MVLERAHQRNWGLDKACPHADNGTRAAFHEPGLAKEYVTFSTACRAACYTFRRLSIHKQPRDSNRVAGFDFRLIIRRAINQAAFARAPVAVPKNKNRDQREDKRERDQNREQLHVAIARECGKCLRD